MDARLLFASAEVVLKYVARYTHRVVISNARLISMENGKVRFRFQDYADGGKQKTTEFIRRFLPHVLPLGFIKIRHFGFLANRFRHTKLALCRPLLGISVSSHAEGDDQESEQKRFNPLVLETFPQCPVFDAPVTGTDARQPDPLRCTGGGDRSSERNATIDIQHP